MTALRVMVRITSRGGFHFFLFTNKGVPIFRLLRQIMPPDGAETNLALGKSPRLASVVIQHQGTHAACVISFVPKFQT